MDYVHEYNLRKTTVQLHISSLSVKYYIKNILDWSIDIKLWGPLPRVQIIQVVSFLIISSYHFIVIQKGQQFESKLYLINIILNITSQIALKVTGKKNKNNKI